MKEIQVLAGTSSKYMMYIGEDILNSLNYSKVFKENKILFVIDVIVYQKHTKKIEDFISSLSNEHKVIMIDGGEENKTFASYKKIIDFAHKHYFDRHSVFVAIGGGVIGDLCGFAASTYMRGVDYIQIPTTLLAHDSSIGGKNGVNLEDAKNIVGTIYQPKMVVFDTSFLATLDNRNYIAGIVEMIVHGIISQNNIIDILSKCKEDVLKRDLKIVTDLIYKSAMVKTKFIEEDIYDKDVRAFLNLGHTFGHAIESVSEYSIYNHGEAVSIGLLMASKLSDKLDISSSLFEEIFNLLIKYNLHPNINGNITTNAILQALKNDKKVVNNTPNFILPLRIGKVVKKSISLTNESIS